MKMVHLTLLLSLFAWFTLEAGTMPPLFGISTLPCDFHTFGTAYTPDVQKAHVSLSGSAVSEFNEPIDGFRVCFAGVEEKISLPPLKTKFFNVQLDMAGKDQLNNVLIALYPLSGSKVGSPLFQINKPSYPIPTQKETDMIGGGDFLGVGLHILNLLSGFGGLKPTDSVLDVGCGLGRAAYPLTYYLSPTARYEGFDVHPQLIQKANHLVGRHFSNFRFSYVDVYNGHYNPGGRLLSTEFQFPYEDSAFDFAFLTSVFTHMLSHDIRHYLEELARVLKIDGTCLLTCFLLDKESRANIAANTSTLKFTYAWNDCVLYDFQIPEWAVAYDMDYFFEILNEYGFEIVKFYKGSWNGRKAECATYQDLVVIKKTDR